tara:strand:+ start:2870 stop:3043 length:174 start_codon:yes stop_codon:yes gene_type:complete
MMKVGDLVINLYDKDDGIGVIIGKGQDHNGMFRVYWPLWDTSVMFHNSRIEVLDESR